MDKKTKDRLKVIAKSYQVSIQAIKDMAVRYWLKHNVSADDKINEGD